MITEVQERNCLKYNPFEGDFGDPGDKILKKKMVTAKKGGFCKLCQQEIKPGERIRVQAEIFEGTFENYRWCEQCCIAMAENWFDEGESLSIRMHLAQK